MKTVFLSWENYNRRSDLIAQQLNAKMINIHYGQRGNLLQAPLRYLIQAQRSWQALRSEQPYVVFVQNPPIFVVALVYAYARRFGTRFAIDSHTSTFTAPKWRWSLGLHRVFSAAAVTTIVTNRHLQDLVAGWGCPAMVLGFTPGHYPQGEPFPFDGQFHAVVPSSFEWDEPLDVLFSAATQLPDITFYVTGDYRRAPAHLLAQKPSNCHLTGYLPYEQYIGLLRGADVIVDLVTRDHTLLLGAFEAVSLGVPLIISDWPVLREYFARGAIHTPNTVEGIRAAVREAQANLAQLKRDVLLLRDELDREWEIKSTELKQLLEQTGMG